MTISPTTERILSNLRARGLWLQVDGDHLRVITAPGAMQAGNLPPTLARQIGSQRDELMQVVPKVNPGDFATHEPKCRWKRRTADGWIDCTQPSGSHFYCLEHRGETQSTPVLNSGVPCERKEATRPEETGGTTKIVAEDLAK